MSARPRVQCIVTVDTEPDNVWADFRSASLRNVLGLERFHRVMGGLRMRPTYLLTHSVVSDARCVETLRRLQGNAPCEIGAHLHAWETPPFLPGGEDREHAVFSHDLPADHFRRKMETLTQAIAAQFGSPTSYRGGRFGFAPEHIAVLEALGYLVDSSITPLLDRRGKYGLPRQKGGKGGRDYRRAPLEPYQPNYSIDTRPGSARLLELPLTVGTDRPVPKLVLALQRYGPSVLRRALSRLGVSRVIHASWPEVSWPDLEALLRTALAEGRRVFHFMLHSSETMPGGAPWIRTEQDVSSLLDRARRCAEFLTSRAEVEFRTLSEAARCAREVAGQPAWGSSARGGKDAAEATPAT